ATASTTLAPRSASGSVLARVRLYTVSSCPASSSRPASALPIRPVPIQPSRGKPTSFTVTPPLPYSPHSLQGPDRDQGSAFGQESAPSRPGTGVPPVD